MCIGISTSTDPVHSRLLTSVLGPAFFFSNRTIRKLVFKRFIMSCSLWDTMCIRYDYIIVFFPSIWLSIVVTWSCYKFCYRPYYIKNRKFIDPTVLKIGFHDNVLVLARWRHCDGIIAKSTLKHYKQNFLLSYACKEWREFVFLTYKIKQERYWCNFSEFYAAVIWIDILVIPLKNCKKL